MRCVLATFCSNTSVKRLLELVKQRAVVCIITTSTVFIRFIVFHAFSKLTISFFIELNVLTLNTPSHKAPVTDTFHLWCAILNFFI